VSVSFAGCRKGLLLLAVLIATIAAAHAVEPCAEMIRLRTSDGVRLDGVIYRPVSKPRATALVLVHGFGGEFYSGYFPQLALDAATQGYATLALSMRDHGMGPKVSDFGDSQTDIAAAAEYLRKQGFSKLALLGQSMGTNQVLMYQAGRGDSAVAATVLVGGPGDPFEWNVWQVGKQKAQATVDEAIQLRDAGKEHQLMLVDMGPIGKLLYSPRYLLSIRGPQRRSNPYQNLQKIKSRVLIVQGKADKLVPPEVPERLRAARSEPQPDLVYIDGADHGFARHERELIDAVLSWLKRVAP
jgi:pimeloyl-ACP methyl ester carboxylesterase